MPSKTDKILIVEDVSSLAMVYQEWLTKAGYEVLHADTGEAALGFLRSEPISIVLLDMQLPDLGGMDILDFIRAEGLSPAVIVVTASGSINTAVSTMQAGAYDFLVKPVARERLLTTVQNAGERQELHKVVRDLTHPDDDPNLGGIIGSSLPMVAVYRTIEAVSRSNASVFITGESGTGKELCAQAIHASSPRASGPFVALNCAAIPKDLVESEIFGHVKGAFTGATGNRDGAARSADGGVLFLDEICEMDIALQPKLLRLLQTGTVQRVGEDKLQKVDIRIVCATNRDPLTEVEEGRFREDLFYRLHVVPIHLPPLRERDDDVIEIAAQLLLQLAEEEGKSFASISEKAKNVLRTHHWPGNIRELQNVIRNAVVLNDGDVLEPEMLPDLGSFLAKRDQSTTSKIGGTATGPEIRLRLGAPFDVLEQEIIEAAIAHNQGSIPKAAKLLELSPSTIYRKREAWG